MSLSLISRSVLFCVLLFKARYEAASLAGLGQEAAERSVYMPWPQSGRMQCEENKKKPDTTASRIITR
jgi:hypothetical protein